MASAPVVFYYRDGCHLCEAFVALLFREWPAQAGAMEWRDVDADPQWRGRYGERVPVLAQGDREICALHPDAARITRYFGNPVNPV